MSKKLRNFHRLNLQFYQDENLNNEETLIEIQRKPNLYVYYESNIYELLITK